MFKLFNITLFVLALLAGNAMAACTGKTVNIKLPSSWSTSTICLKIDGMNSQTLTSIGNGWYQFTFGTGDHAGDGGKSFSFQTSQSGCGEDSQKKKINSVDWDKGVDPNSNKWKCDDLAKEVYIYENTTNQGRTVLSTDPPDARIFYFLPPGDDKWKASSAYFLKSGGAGPVDALTGLKPKAMDVDPVRCGWYKVVFFNKPVPDEITYFSLEPEPASSVGLLHIGNNDGSGTLKKKFDEMHGEGVSGALYYVSAGEKTGWHKTDPGVDEPDRCKYSLKAKIYHTSCQANSSFSAHSRISGCSNDGGDGEGICRGYVKTDLGSNGKMQWGNNSASCASNSRAWKSEADFVKAFDPNSKDNVERCFEMPFSRASNGNWEFDALYLCSDGTQDLGGNCSGGQLSTTYRIGGFYPPNLTKKTDQWGDYTSQYATCNGCGQTYGGDAGVVPASCVNTWCFDRGWKGGTCGGIPNEYRRTTSGDLTGKDTKAAIDAEMMEHCWQPLADGDIKNYGDPTPMTGAGGKADNISGLLCFESSAKFVYQQGQEFFFRGDDDIWVFINKKLVLDLGGNHGPAPGFVKLDTIGKGNSAIIPPLTEGKEYDLHVFFCDRRGPGANVRISTNMYISQRTGWSIDGDLETGVSVCLTVSNDKEANCGGGAGGGGEETYCGGELGEGLNYYMRKDEDGATNISLNPDENPQCEWDNTKTIITCYEGIYVDISKAEIRVDKDKIKGDIYGVYKVYVKTNSNFVGSASTSEKSVGSFNRRANVVTVWGKIRPDNNDKKVIYDLGPKDRNTVAGKLLPVGFAVITTKTSDGFLISMTGSPGADVELNANDLINNGIYANMKVYLDSLGEKEVKNLNERIVIPKTGDFKGLLVLWVAGNYDASDDYTYKVNVAPGGAKPSDPLTIKVFLPTLKFIDPATKANPLPTALKAGTWETKGSDISNGKSTSTASAESMITDIYASQGRTVAAFDPSSGTEVLCTSCEFPVGYPIGYEAWAVVDNETLDLKDGALIFVEPTKVSKGIADISFYGVKALLPKSKTGNPNATPPVPPALFDTVGYLKIKGPSIKTSAQWDSLFFEKPDIPLPSKAEIYDRDGDGIGDELRIVYGGDDGRYIFPNGKTNCGTFTNSEDEIEAATDSLPNYIEIFWDLDMLDTIGFGHPRVVKRATPGGKGYEYSNLDKDGKPIPREEMCNFWKDKILLHTPGEEGGGDTLVIKWADVVASNKEKYSDYPGFSRDVKTSVGPREMETKMFSWASYKKNDDWSTSHPDKLIRDKMPPIVISAFYTPDETSGCEASATGCDDELVINLSEPVFLVNEDAHDNAIKTAFAYKLIHSHGMESFEVFDKEGDLPYRMRWSGSERPSADTENYKGDSTIKFSFSRIERTSGSSKTPVANDSIKLASIKHINILAIMDKAGNVANPEEKGRVIEGRNPVKYVKVPIAELDPSDNALKNALDNLKDEGIIINSEDYYKKGNPVEILPILPNWKDSEIKNKYPGSVGLVIKPDIQSSIRDLELEIKQIYGVEVTIPEENISFKAKTFFHTSLGNFVANKDLEKVSCDDERFKQNGVSFCKTAGSAIYVAWNLKDNKDRWVGTGAYVGLYDFYWSVEGFEFQDKNGNTKTMSRKLDSIERRVEMVGVKRIKSKK